MEKKTKMFKTLIVWNNQLNGALNYNFEVEERRRKAFMEYN